MFKHRDFQMFSLQALNEWAGGLLLWLKLPARKFGDRGFKPNSALQVSKKQNVSSPLTRKDPILCGASVTER